MKKKRDQILAALGAGETARKELLEYNRNRFGRIELTNLPDFPLPDEPQTEVWYEYSQEAQKIGVAASLTKRLPQLSFPIRDGISATGYYRSATLKGVPVQDIPEATGLKLKFPDELELTMHKTQSGTIPVLVARDRQDFISLVQALSAKNEPCRIPDSMGASMISGLNNWDRIARLKKNWEKENPNDFMDIQWNAEFSRIIADKPLYQDQFIILSSSPYSGIVSSELGLAGEEWAKLSLIIRREHECSHYFTKRVLGSMQNRLHDELIADYMGIRAAIGHYRSDWFLRFLGLENYPEYRKGGRLENYCQDAGLSDESFNMLQTIAVRASHNLEQIDKNFRNDLLAPHARSVMIILLSQYSIEELTCDEVVDDFSEQFLMYS